MNIVYSPDFLKTILLLPIKTQRKLDELIAILGENHSHPLLHTKKLSGNLANTCSFRITRDWRVIFMFENPDTIKLLKVGHRKDVYR